MEEVVEAKQNTPSKLQKVIKILAIVVFSLIMTALVTTLVSDIIIFGRQLVIFLFALFASAIVFVIAFVLMVISCICIFGVYILETQGFWPVSWMNQAFTSIVQEAALTPGQAMAIAIIRIVMIVICVIVFIASIVILCLAKKVKKENKEAKQKLTYAFSIVPLVMSILGSFSCLAVFFLMSLLTH